jgi:TfoX/Sxy family transcriptional regulator of competence genes
MNATKNNKKTLQEILSNAYPQIENQYETEFKNCFGAVAGYVDSNIFCSYGKFGFAIKLPKLDIEQLLKEGAEPFRYFPNGHVKKDYAVLPKKIMLGKKRLKKLITTSVEFVAS